MRGQKADLGVVRQRIADFGGSHVLHESLRERLDYRLHGHEPFRGNAALPGRAIDREGAPET